MDVDRGPRCAIGRDRTRSEAMGAAWELRWERVKRRSVRGWNAGTVELRSNISSVDVSKKGGTHDVVDQPARLVDEVQAVERHVRPRMSRRVRFLN